MKRPSLKSLAEQSGYSQSTLFRVLRNYPGIRPETRETVIRLLNIHGYTVENRTGTEKVVVDVSEKNLYTEQLAERIAERLKLEQYNVVKTFSYKKEAAFRWELADADVVIFSGRKGNDWYRLARDINPAVYRVGFFGDHTEEIELLISVDNVGGVTQAADYLSRHFDSIAVFCNPDHRDSAERALIAYGHIRGYYPQLRCDLIRYKSPEELSEFHKERGGDYTAYFYQNGDPWVALEPLIRAEKRNIFQLLFNNPEYIRHIRRIDRKLNLDAYIDFEVPQFSDFVAFYLRNRPLLQHQPRLISLLPTQLIINKEKNRT